MYSNNLTVVINKTLHLNGAYALITLLEFTLIKNM